MIIFVDCDGVLADFSGGIERALGREPVEPLAYRLDVRMGVPFGQVLAAVCTPGFCAGLREIEGAREGLAYLREHHTVLCATAPWIGSPYWHNERLEWLAGLGFAPKDVIFTHRKDVLRGDVLIDDLPDHVVGFAGHGILFAASHNKSNVAWRTIMEALRASDAAHATRHA